MPAAFLHLYSSCNKGMNKVSCIDTRHPVSAHAQNILYGMDLAQTVKTCYLLRSLMKLGVNEQSQTFCPGPFDRQPEDVTDAARQLVNETAQRGFGQVPVDGLACLEFFQRQMPMECVHSVFDSVLL